MESPASFPVSGDVVGKGKTEELLALVDPFIIEALGNPRHRLTVLRMELDIQKFMQNSNQQQFEYQHFPTSYLRCAAHRVAQYYGLQTISLDSIGDGTGSRIIVRKTPDSRYPPLCLSEIPTKQAESEKTEKVKIAIRHRPNNPSLFESNEQGTKKSRPRTVEEREEEYEKARARIFSGSSIAEVQGSPVVSSDGRSLYPCRDEQESLGFVVEENESISVKDSANRIAIFRDREKDRNDPDYDRSYDRYARGLAPSRSFSVGTCTVPAPIFQYEVGYSPLAQLQRTQTPLGYRPPNPNPVAASGFGSTETPRDPVYMQWPSPAMMYAQSYEHFRHAAFQAPFYQQPLSFERPQYR